ncbi:MAG: hypothetical protein ABIG95_05095 [Candidatus Woesearchaeota archaeon]
MRKSGRILKKTIFLLLIIGVILYFLIGFLFTILRSNAHYDYFVEGEYWQERCIEANNYEAFIYGTPGARWCLINGEFRTDEPTRNDWYFNFYFINPRGYNGGFIGTLLLWPLHLVGIDMIHFRSISGVWVLG